MDPSDWMTIKEAAAYLRISEATLFRWRRQGKVAFYRLSPGRRSLLKREEVALLAICTPPPSQPAQPAPPLYQVKPGTPEFRELCERMDRRAAEMARKYGIGDDTAIFLRRERDRMSGRRK